MHTPRPTQRTMNHPVLGVMAWCPSCQAFKPARQVARGKELRNSAGRITATYAAIPHEPGTERQVMSHQIKLTVTVELERTQGKFASRDEMTQALIDELEGMDPGQISGLGADGDTEYEVTDWNVDEA